VRTMFLEEARLAGLIHHPNVVAVSEVREDVEGPYLVMDFVEGVSASKLLHHARATEPLPMQVAIRIAIDVAHGLHAAHEARSAEGEPLELVHRDVTPGNVLVGFDGVARLGDFGVARAMGRSAKTRTGVLKGKLGYLSPEQLQFEEPTRQSDLFALGIVLYELLSATRLYESDNAGARRILKEPPPDVRNTRPEVPAEVAELVLSMLAKTPSRRPATAADVARTLERALADLVVNEGALGVAAFVGERFASERASLRDRIRAAKEEVATVVVSRSRSRWWWLAAAIGVIACASLAAWAIVDLAPSDPDPMPPASATVQAPRSSVPVNELAPSDPSPSRPTVAAPVEKVEPAPIEPSSPPRRARSPRRSATMTAMQTSGDPLIW
jgi:eukaryotic-like serine/threonine-protein kinase